MWCLVGFDQVGHPLTNLSSWPTLSFFYQQKISWTCYIYWTQSLKAVSPQFAAKVALHPWLAAGIAFKIGSMGAWPKPMKNWGHIWPTLRLRVNIVCFISVFLQSIWTALDQSMSLCWYTAIQLWWFRTCTLLSNLFYVCIMSSDWPCEALVAVYDGWDWIIES